MENKKQNKMMYGTILKMPDPSKQYVSPTDSPWWVKGNLPVCVPDGFGAIERYMTNPTNTIYLFYMAAIKKTGFAFGTSVSFIISHEKKHIDTGKNLKSAMKKIEGDDINYVIVKDVDLIYKNGKEKKLPIIPSSDELQVMGVEDNIKYPLHYFVTTEKYGYDPRLKLLSNGYDINMSDSRGFTPLSIAVVWNKQMVEWLIQNGANINVLHNDGGSPLHVAMRKGKDEIVEILIRHGAIINVKSNRV